MLLHPFDSHGTGRWQGLSNRIVSINDPVDGTDAVNLQTLDTRLSQHAVGSPAVPLTSWTHTATSGTRYAIAGAQLASATSYLVVVGGVIQEPTTDYSIDTVNEEIVFTTAPTAGLRIVVRQFLGLSRDVPIFTTATRPTAASRPNTWIVVKDAGAAAQLQFALQGAAGTYSWHVVAVGTP
jgi:hypothetical protein